MKHLMVHGTPSPARARGRHFCSVSVLAACLAMPSTAAFCAVQVSGKPQAVSVNTQNSSLKDILAELEKKFNLRLELPANLDKRVTGTYQGSLRRVVSRLLEGYDFIIRTDQAGLDVIVFGTQNGPGGSAPFTVVAANGIAPEPAPMVTAAGAQTAATATSMPTASTATAHSAEIHPAPAEILSPVLASAFRIAQGPLPSPAPPATSMNGLVPGPATATMPKPTPSTATMPTPIGAPTPFPPVSGTNTSAPNAIPATSPTPPTPTPGTR